MKNNPESRRNSFTGAIILIVLGVFFLLQRLGISAFENWWAFFFLIPAISSLGNLIQEIRIGNGFRFSIASSLLGTLFPTAIALMFLFDLNWEKYWPLFVILAGLSMILTGLIEEEAPVGNFVKRFRPWLLSWGTGVVVFGGLIFLEILLPTDFYQFQSRFLGIPIMIASLGGIISSILGYKNGHPSKLFVGLNLITTLFLALPGILALMGIQLQIIGSLLIIALGLLLIIGVLQKR
jgi:hypothetical protein